DGNIDKLKTGYFVLFIVSALANGFNVRDQKYGIFKGLNLNPGFLRVMCAIIAVQAVIVNCGLIPLAPFQWLGKMFSCVPFGISGWVVVVLMALTMIPVDLIRKTVSGPAKTAE
ncbi:MAG: cation transporting ATPase C-terminal domain-containing protein, partial [Ruminococcus sp.]|nr:cation transporting ATPase C-terminal domain-containing protein [Ruminococcus sp.]